MRSVKVKRTDLLAAVLTNLAKHIGEYDEAVEDYKAVAIKVAKENLKLANSGDLTTIAKVRPMPAPPVSYEAEYNRAVKMLQMSVEEEIELEDDVFNQLVMDEWSWKRAFSVSNMAYKSAM